MLHGILATTVRPFAAFTATVKQKSVTSTDSSPTTRWKRKFTTDRCVIKFTNLKQIDFKIIAKISQALLDGTLSKSNLKK